MLDGTSLLVLEDDPDTLDLFTRSLVKLGAEVRVATNAEAALAILCTWQPSAVLCDLHLPGIDGYGFLARVREVPALRGVPVIAISASHPSIERERAIDAGFAAHLVKPSPLADIIAVVKSITAQRAAVI